MGAASPSHVSLEDYLAREGSGDTKHEWCDGVVYAMSRGSPEHGRLTMNIGRVLGNALQGMGCALYSPDTMLFVEAANLATYADASVVCGTLKTKTVRKNGRSLGEAVINPVVVIEVLSESTERYDRDGKFQAYKSLSSVKEYVLISQDEPRIEVYRRDQDWACESAGAGGQVTIHGQRFDVDSVYR